MALGLLCAPAPAHADWLGGTRGGATMGERDHQIELSFERGYATMTVTRTVHNEHHDYDEAVFDLALPPGAVATALRTSTEARGRLRWYAGELLDSDLALERYTELTGFGPHAPMDPALLAWDGHGSLTLQVFPVAPQGDKTIEYTLDMPAIWREGRWVLDLEGLGIEGSPPTLRVTADHRRDQLFVDGVPVPSGHELSLDAANSFALEPHRGGPVALELAELSTSKDRALVHWRMSLDAALSSLPQDARVVVALDLSRSMDPAQIEAQRQATLLYLSHFLDPALGSQVAVVGFDHELHMITPGLVPAAEAVDSLRAATLSRGNGSDLGLALRAATTLLGSAPGHAPKRAVLMTDFNLSSRLEPSDYADLTADSGAIIHLAHVAPSGAYLERDDQHDWSSVALGSGGVLWRANADLVLDPDELANAQAVYEEWARPLRLDNLRADFDGASPQDSFFPDTLAEGEGHDELLFAADEPRALRVRGSRWGTAVEFEAMADPALGRRWAGLTFGSDSFHHESLDEDEMRHLAQRAGVVSPVTSYLAIEPGVKPSNIGFADDEGFGLIGKGGCGGSGIGRGYSSGVAFTGRLDRQAWLDAQLNAAWMSCGGSKHTGELTLQSTYDELVDLNVTWIGPADSQSRAALEACVLEQGWGLRLSTDDFVEYHRTWVVQLSGH